MQLSEMNESRTYKSGVRDAITGVIIALLIVSFLVLGCYFWYLSHAKTMDFRARTSEVCAKSETDFCKGVLLKWGE